MTKKQQQKRKNVESESIPQETSRKTSKKQKTVAEPTRNSKRIARQDSDLAGATRNLKISSDSDLGSRSSYGLKDLPTSASLFTEEDMEALNVIFKSKEEEGKEEEEEEEDSIPGVKVTNIPNQYVLPNIGRDALERKKFDVRKLKDEKGEDTDGYVKQFYKSLHRVVMNEGVSTGTDESKTDSLVNHLLNFVCGFNCWPFGIRIKESYKLLVSKKTVSAKPDFVVDMEEIVIIITEDKHIKNVSPPDYGESQMVAEILACGYENMLLHREITDQIIYAIRVISSYVTFYQANIPAEYLKELKRGLPQNQSIEVLRWPGENDPECGLDLAVPDDRRVIFETIIEIRQSLLRSTAPTRKSSKSSKSEGKKPLK